MTLVQFGRLIKRPLVVETSGKVARCYYANVLYGNGPRAAVVSTAIGCGPNQERARVDLVQKVRGKVARVYDGMGAYTEFPVPRFLTA
jgi:hypothetical protein